jgi:ketosteroid isomerase-like protein
MSEENVEIVRQPVVVRADTRRSLDQKLFVRLPSVSRALFRVSWRWMRRLSPRSRLRRAVLRTLIPRACEALNRGDLEVFSIFVHPEIESVNTPEVVALGGLVPGSHGREAWLEGQRRWLADWGALRYEPDEVLDLGDDRLLLLGRGRGIGRASGIEIDTEWGLLATISDGLLAREQNFLDRADALKAAGLSE